MKVIETAPSPSRTGSSREIVAGLWGVTKTFDSYLTRSLAGVTIEVARGEVFGLFGPEGSGKSTVLRMLAGQLRPTEGKVKVFGQAPWRARSRARIGYLPGKKSPARSTGVFGWLARALPWNRPGPDSFREGLSLSAGRGNGLAQAVLGSRDLIILDEPFVDLNDEIQAELKELVLTLAGRGKTVIFSSNSLIDATRFCHRAAILFRGQVQAVGTLDELLSGPDAIRMTGPILPRATAERALKLIREELTGGARGETEIAPPANTPGHSPAEVPQAEPSVTATVTEAALAPLLRVAGPGTAADSRGSAADDVDHEKLAGLTQASGVSASEPERPPDANPRPADADEKLSKLLKQPGDNG